MMIFLKKAVEKQGCFILFDLYPAHVVNHL